MAKYLLLKHYRGAPAAVNDVPMDRWTQEEISAHLRYMNDFAKRLEGTGEYVDSQALSPEGTFAGASDLLIAMGETGPEIAEHLHLSHDTVRTHVRNAMAKLGARSRAHLVAKALSEGLIAN